MLNVLETPYPVCLQIPPSLSLLQSGCIKPRNLISKTRSRSKSSASSVVPRTLSSRLHSTCSQLLPISMASANAISTASLISPLSQVSSSPSPSFLAFALCDFLDNCFLVPPLRFLGRRRPSQLRSLAQFGAFLVR